MAEGYNLSMLAVLIADKNAHMRHMLRGILRELNVRMVTEASSIEEAVKLLAVKPLDLAFVEWAPDFDGNTIVRQTRRDPQAMSRMIPIITMSAYTEVQNVIASRDAGSDQFLAKPFTAKMIFQHLKAVIENQQPFVRSKAYFGPSRRRKTKPPPDGWERRGAKPKESKEEATPPSDSKPATT
ncbi:MAG: response regulator [Alphaproteobacteria bacterium]|nr:response regulator [Alphaproteobacteria bacterium]